MRGLKFAQIQNYYWTCSELESGQPNITQNRKNLEYKTYNKTYIISRIINETLKFRVIKVRGVNWVKELINVTKSMTKKRMQSL